MELTTALSVVVLCKYVDGSSSDFATGYCVLFFAQQIRTSRPSKGSIARLNFGRDRFSLLPLSELFIINIPLSAIKSIIITQFFI